MQQAERVSADIARAATALSDDGAERLVGDAARWLEDVADAVEGRLDPALDALSRAMDALGEAQSTVTACMDALEFHPGALEELEDRLFAIRGLARKHGVPPDELSAFAGDLRARLDRLDNSARTWPRCARRSPMHRRAMTPPLRRYPKPARRPPARWMPKWRANSRR